MMGYEQYGCDIAARAITAARLPHNARLLVSGINTSTVLVPEVAVEAGPRFSGSIPCFCPAGFPLAFAAQNPTGLVEMKGPD